MASRRDGPIIVQNDRTILLDVHHEAAEEAREHLGLFAELVKSPDNLHTYRISSLSLWNAAAVGLTSEDVTEFLKSWSRFPVPKAVRREVAATMERYGRLILRRHENGRLLLCVAPEYFEDVIALESLDDHVGEIDAEASEMFVHEDSRGEIKRVLTRAGFPVEDMAGYSEGDRLEFELAKELPNGAPFGLRPYQDAAACAFYQDGLERGGHGVVVLPCGAGKTIVGMGVMNLYQTSTLILTNSSTAVRQWVRELREKTDLPQDAIGEYTSDVKLILPVTVTTYQMLTYRRGTTGTYPHFEEFMTRNWGLLVYDEVHLLPAPVFRITAEIQARRRLGLTATLVREDGREDEVFSLIGPKRYEMPWKRLERGGYIAAAQCVEVRTPLSAELDSTYANASRRDRYRIAAENPLKLAVLEALLEKHRADRVLVIGMYLRQLEQIRILTGADLITSRTPQHERERLYGEFRRGEIDRLIVSKVANFAIDLPDANIAIQVSGTFGSRQEEAQRLGRILRPKEKDCDTIFYSLVTEDTREMVFGTNRQLFLTEQGYAYEIVDARDIVPRFALGSRRPRRPKKATERLTERKRVAET